MFVSKLLVSMFKEATGQTVSSTSELSGESRNIMMEAVLDTVGKFASKDRPIVDAELKCVILRIRCSSITCLLSLLYDCIKGDLNNEFRPLEAAVRQVTGCEEVSVEAVIYEDQFWAIINKTVTVLEDIISQTYNMALQPCAVRQNSETYGISDVRLCDNTRRPQQAVRITVKTDLEGQRHLKNSIKAGSINSSINRLREEIVKQYDIKNLSIEARLFETGSESHGAFADLHAKVENRYLNVNMDGTRETMLREATSTENQQPKSSLETNEYQVDYKSLSS
ncbi:uncharacterized protein LOC128553840, partial [Mercenaria mercenaria]|uniref:uncharacterized protein LOC128553840 n=1 Tax=Mercenaria mercenaria TaxID=6596 RepID=UPI00234E589C